MAGRIQKYDTYIEGNTVRKLNTVPVRVPEPRKRPERQPAKRKQKSISKAYVFFLVIAVGIVLFTCMQYLSFQAKNIQLSSDITSIEKNITELSTQNDSLEYSIKSNIDLNEIIRVATQELGMVKSSKDNVVYYEDDADEYMVQYKDISE